MLLQTGKSSGFTLIEILIALFIVAIVVIGISGVQRTLIYQQHQLQDKVLAHWVVQNQTVLLRLKPTWLNQNKTLTYANQRWQLQWQTQPAIQSGLFKALIRVRKSNEDHWLAQETLVLKRNNKS